MIEVKELSTLSQGEKNSDSQALSNPRLFVMDKKGNVMLPLNLVWRKKQGENCNITYDDQGQQQKKNCSPIIEPSQYFVGLKTFSVTPEQGIKEIFARDYFQEILAKKGETSGDRQNFQREWRYSKEIQSLKNMRVGYAGDALYTFNDLFADFIFPTQKNYSLWFK